MYVVRSLAKVVVEKMMVWIRIGSRRMRPSDKCNFSSGGGGGGGGEGQNQHDQTPFQYGDEESDGYGGPLKW